MELQASREFAKSLDRDDELSAFRNRFYIPKQANGEEHIYFMGNSLGLQAKQTGEYLQEELCKWKDLGGHGYFRGKHPWVSYGELLCEPMARVVGGLPSEVVTMNSLTTNLHLAMISFYRPTPQRHKILIEDHAFPSDHYLGVARSKLRFKRTAPKIESLGKFYDPSAQEQDDYNKAIRTYWG